MKALALQAPSRLEDVMSMPVSEKVAKATSVGALDWSAQRLQPLKRIVCLVVSLLAWNSLQVATFGDSLFHVTHAWMT